MDVQTSLLGLDTRLGSVVSQELITSEIPLPNGRDAEAVLSAYARAFVEEATCLDDAIHITGRLELICSCLSMSGDTYGFTAQSTFSSTLALAGTKPNMRADVSAQVLECSAPPDALRLNLTAVLELSAFVSAPVTTPFITGISGGRGLEKRMTSMEVRKRVQLAEATIRLREESDAGGVRRVLLYHGAAQTTQLHFTGASTCEAEGRLLVTTLVETEAGEAQSMLFTLPFTCSFDAQYLPTVWVSCTVESLSAVAADISFGVVDVEAVLRLKLHGVETSTCDALLDAYDMEGSFRLNAQPVERLCCSGAVQQTFTIQENVLIPQQLPDAMRAVYATAMPAVTGLFETENGMLGADVMLLTCIVYRCDEGRLHSFCEDIPAQLRFDAPFSPDAQVNVRSLSTVASGSGRALTVSYLLEGDAVLYCTESTDLASELADTAEPCPYSGILIYCADAGDTLWDVGKRFQVPLGSLNIWNPDLCEPLTEGQAVVLMR